MVLADLARAGLERDLRKGFYAIRSNILVKSAQTRKVFSSGSPGQIGSLNACSSVIQLDIDSTDYAALAARCRAEWAKMEAWLANEQPAGI